MLSRLNRRTLLRAQDLADAGETGSLIGDIARGLARFWTSYVWRQGLREGELGFLIALMTGFDAVLAGVRARELVKLRATAATEPAAQLTQLGLAGRR